jgi:hypothetical protein
VRPTTLITGAAKAFADRLLGGRQAPHFLQYAEKQMDRAVRIWQLEPLAPITAARRSITWTVLRDGEACTLKLPIVWQEPTRDAHVALGQRGLGLIALESVPGNGLMLLEGAPSLLGRSDVSFGNAGTEAHDTICRVLDMLSATPAVAGAKDATATIVARLARNVTTTPDQVEATRKAVETIGQLSSAAHTTSFCHGRIDRAHVIASGHDLKLTGPKAAVGDPHIDLAAWILRASPDTAPLPVARERAAAAAETLGWEAARAAAWTDVLHAAGVRPNRRLNAKAQSSCHEY